MSLPQGIKYSQKSMGKTVIGVFGNSRIEYFQFDDDDDDGDDDDKMK